MERQFMGHCDLDSEIDSAGSGVKEVSLKAYLILCIGCSPRRKQCGGESD